MSERVPVDLDNLPRIDLRQLLALTDSTGLLQHATFGAPDHHHGYCIDDNCRALIAALIHTQLCGYDEAKVPLQRYLAFVAYAFNLEIDRFRNFMGYHRQWLEEVGSEDSHGRTIWSLGLAVRLAPNDSIRGLADRLLHQARPGLNRLEFIRPKAYGLLGLDEYLQAVPDDTGVCEQRQNLAQQLFEAWQAHAAKDWPWWEDTLTWGNAKLPQALLVSGRGLECDDMITTGLRTLEWLLQIQTAPEGHLSVIGNDGWYKRHGKRAQFDQQPIEAQCLVQACLTAADVTGQQRWVDEALRSFGWFLGYNDVGLPLYNPDTGGCHDGLKSDGVNLNQGAESTLAYVLSLLELHWFRRRTRPVAAATTAHVKVTSTRVEVAAGGAAHSQVNHVMQRATENPLIKPSDVRPSRPDYEVIGAFNAGVARYQDQVILLLRVAERPTGVDPQWLIAPIWNAENGDLETLRVHRDDPGLHDEEPRLFRYKGNLYLTSISHLRIARSLDGIRFSVDPKPAMWPSTTTESYGLEDPRITQIGNTYWITYKAVSPHGIATALAQTDDFETFTRHGLIFCPENLDVVLFPDTLNGKYAAWTRPAGRNMGKLAIWAATGPDLIHWADHRPVLQPRPGFWDGERVGASCVPIRTAHGWLAIYHGADPGHRYCMGAALIDSDDPSRILARSHDPLMQPEAPYEAEGFFSRVVFPCGADTRPDGTVTVYYGASDESTCAATTTVQQLLDHLNV